MRELFQAAEENGVTIEYCRLPLNGSVSAPGEKGDFILMDYDLIGAGPDEWVHLAHELGHCVTGSFYNRYAVLDVRRKHENRADKWAVKKLLSVEALDEAVADGCTEMWELAERFGVTQEFMEKAVCLYTYGNMDVEEYMRF